ncbi:MAG: IseA DL-endopeptidase inhibitor family protein [Bacillota bacterium]|nr:IseA DL-endopeptidase inhibitor family protein [Bacillota bacterium]
MVISLFTLGTSAYAKSSTDSLTNSLALKLALNAKDHYWSAIEGFNIKSHPSSSEYKTFTYKGIQYRYFSNEFDTKAKFIKYLNESYTLNAINKGFKKYHFIVHNGKLAEPNADGGSVANWKEAKVKLLYHREGVRLYQFTDPLGDSKGTEKHNVTFVKVHYKWQINNFDAVQ